VIFLGAIRFARRARGCDKEAGLSGGNLLENSPRFVKVAVAAMLSIGVTFTLRTIIDSHREL
jgi:hypothetical protein